MSIGGIAAGLSQQLASLLAQLDSVSPASSSSSSNTSSAAATASPFSTDDDSDSSQDNQLTGSAKAQLSDQILGLLTMMQQQASQGASGATTSTSIATISTSANPLQNLMSAMDANNDGEISESEMEAYIEKNGGTQAQADALYNGLSQNGATPLTTAQLTTDLAQGAAGGPQGVHGHHHHHGHHGSGGSSAADDIGSLLAQAMDTNGDGSVSQSEFENFVTNLGGTTSEADSDFTALDPQNTGAVGAAQFSNAIKAFEAASQNSQSVAAGAGAPILDLLDTLKQFGTPNANASNSNTQGILA